MSSKVCLLQEVSPGPKGPKEPGPLKNKKAKNRDHLTLISYSYIGLRLLEGCTITVHYPEPQERKSLKTFNKIVVKGASTEGKPPSDGEVETEAQEDIRFKVHKPLSFIKFGEKMYDYCEEKRKELDKVIIELNESDLQNIRNHICGIQGGDELIKNWRDFKIKPQVKKHKRSPGLKTKSVQENEIIDLKKIQLKQDNFELRSTEKEPPIQTTKESPETPDNIWNFNAFSGRDGGSEECDRTFISGSPYENSK